MLIIGLEYLGHIRPSVKKTILVRRIASRHLADHAGGLPASSTVTASDCLRTTCARRRLVNSTATVNNHPRWQSAECRKPQRAFPLDRSHELEGIGC
jgi:hypothetical protein